MIDFNTRIASLVLAFGFFFGCSTLKNTPDLPANPSATDQLSEAQFEQYLAGINQKIADNRQSPVLYYQKGALLTRWAQQRQNPEQRTPLYTKADQALSTADSLSDSNATMDNSRRRDIDQLRKVAWSNEHNQGITALQHASNPDDYRKAAVYFTNATAIMPDSIASYKRASKAYYKGNQPQKAVAALESARQKADPLPTEITESLAFLYFQTGQYQKAIEAYKRARTQRNHSYNLMHGLANAYMKAQEHRQAVGLLEQLVNQRPGNLTYRYSLASEAYQAARQQLQNIAQDLEKDHAFNIPVFQLADSLFNIAKIQYRYLRRNQVPNDKATFKLAQFYQNKAAAYQSLLPYVNRSRSEEITSIITQSVSSSIPLLEQLTRKNSNRSKQLWQYLYRTYSYLGMQEKAQNAKSKL